MSSEDTTPPLVKQIHGDRIPYRLTAQRMGAAIGAALEADGISQAEFCRRVGTSAKHLNQVIHGVAVARAAELDYWAWALGREWSVTLSVPGSSGEAR